MIDVVSSLMIICMPSYARHLIYSLFLWTLNGSLKPRSLTRKPTIMSACPVGKGNKTEAIEVKSTASSPSSSNTSPQEPPDRPDKPSKCPMHAAKIEKVENPQDEGDIIPAAFIPASGRGNSDDGKAWLNPSANQLYRAMRRKDKPIEHQDALAVAAIHEA